MFQTREQDKSPEKDFNEKETSNLLDRVQSIGHKDAH